MPPPSPGVPAQLFYSYSHKDEKLRDQLEIHLSTLKRENRISAWHDRRITAGTEWKGEIDEHLKSASVILLLVTANFLSSDYCHDVELRYAMEQHQKGKARVIPVILRPCDWKTTIFAKLHALPTDGKPVINWKTRDDAFVNVVEGIRKALDGLDGLSDGSSSPTFEMAPASHGISVPVLNALHQLPIPPADFTGRADELKQLLQAVKTGGVPISGLQGLGGVGKTALALKLAEQLKADYPDAQFYLDLKGVSPQPLTPRDAMAYIIRAWYPTAQLPEKEEELAPLYRSVLEGKRALLLMDNACDAQQVVPLIPPAGCLVLVTSRKHFTLPGLLEKNLDNLPPADARDLLLRIAPRLHKEKNDQVDELASLCGYLPLALRAVASALQEKKNISPADYAARLKETGKHLVLKEIDPSLQKSVGAALQSSYEILSADVQQKFRFLAVFPGTFDRSAAAAVWELPLENAQDALSELFAYSLIEFDEISKRYNLHDLVRLFADQLSNAAERYSAQKCHAGHYLKVLAAAEELYLKGSDSVIQGLSLFDSQWTNIQAGETWAAAHQEEDDTIAAWCALYGFSGAQCRSLRQYSHQQIRLLEPALAASRHLKQPRWEASVLGNLGSVYFKMGEFRRSIEYYEQYLKIAHKIGDLLDGKPFSGLGIAYDCLGEHDRAVDYHLQHLAIARKTGNRIEEGRALGHLGLVYANLGKHDRAIDYHLQHLRIAHETGDLFGEASALGNLGLAYYCQRDYHRAIEYHEQCLSLHKELGDRDGESLSLGNLGISYHNLGELQRAIDYQEQSLRIATSIGNRLAEAHALFNIAMVLHELGNHPAAIARIEASLNIYETIESLYAVPTRNQLSKWRGEDKARGKGNAE